VCWTADNDGIGDEGAIRIAKGLKKNPSLKELDLRSVVSAHYSTIQSCESFRPVLFCVSVVLKLCNLHFCD
jgi:hypothetical protein